MKIGQRARGMGIGGFLVWLAMGLTIGPVVAVFGVVVLIMTANDRAPRLLTMPGFWLNILLDVGLIAATVFVAVRFFQRRRSAVRLMIALVLGYVGVNLLEAAVWEAMVGRALNSNAVALSVIYAAIWVPYFLCSKRVKDTFVCEPGEPEPDEAW